MMRIKDQIRYLAATNTAVAVSVAYLLGLRGMLQGRRGSFDHIKSTISLSTKSSTIMGCPINVTIEPTNLCNLKCPVCETGSGVLQRDKGSMTIEQFKMVIDKIGKQINTIMFYFMGEPFLNRNSYEMIRYAKDKGVPFIETCTNGDLVNPEELVSCGIDRISFQIGGMSEETHSVYRVNSNLDKIVANLKEALRIRRERSSGLKIETGFILMKHNEHEVDIYRRYMYELGVDRAFIVDPCVRTIEQGVEMLPDDKKHWIYDPFLFSHGILKPKKTPNNICPWIYYSTVILVNGDVVPCCRDATGKEIMGNIFKENLSEIWNGEKYQSFRERILKNQKSIDICRLCSGYPPSALN